MFRLLYQRVLWDLIFSWEENGLATKECQKKKIEKKGEKKKFPQWKFPLKKKQQQKPTQ